MILVLLQTNMTMLQCSHDSLIIVTYKKYKTIYQRLCLSVGIFFDNARPLNVYYLIGTLYVFENSKLWVIHDMAILCGYIYVYIYYYRCSSVLFHYLSLFLYKTRYFLSSVIVCSHLMYTFSTILFHIPLNNYVILSLHIIFKPVPSLNILF